MAFKNVATWYRFGTSKYQKVPFFEGFIFCVDLAKLDILSSINKSYNAF